MASNFTANYQLNQWEEEDAVRRVDFNADNAKIDAAIKAVDLRVDGKAEASALASEASTRASAVSSLNSSVSALNYSLSRRGNCSIQTSSYTGDGTTTKTLSFSSAPKFLVIIGPQTAALISGSAGVSFVQDPSKGTAARLLTLAWSGARLTITPYVGGEASHIMNGSGISYTVISFHDVS